MNTYVTIEGGDTFEKVLYTGMIDEFFAYCEGALEYRSLDFQTELLEGEETIKAMRLSTTPRGRFPIRAL